MKTTFSQIYTSAAIFICLVAFLMPMSLQAQKMNHRASPGGDQQARPQPSSSPNQSINGGNQSSQSRMNSYSGSPSTSKYPSGANTGAIGNTKPATTTSNTSNMSTGNKNNVSTGNKSNVSSNTNVSNNNVNVNNSKTNVNVNNSTNVNVNNSKNVNVNNSKTTVVVVKPGPTPYPRPPYMYGGHSYYCYHPYYYHPYYPYPYPAYHPAGFYVAVVPTTAVVVSVQTQTYYYDQGIYYMSGNGGYVVVPAPVGATVTTLPPATQTVAVTETTNNYYYGGTYYEKNDNGYVVVPPTAGCVVENLPEGGVETKVGDVTYVKVGETYYQPIEKNGKNMYEVVEVKADK